MTELRISRGDYRANTSALYDMVINTPGLRVHVDCDVCPFSFEHSPADVPRDAPAGVWFREEACDGY